MKILILDLQYPKLRHLIIEKNNIIIEMK